MIQGRYLHLALAMLLGIAALVPCAQAQPDVAQEPTSAATPGATPTSEPTPTPTSSTAPNPTYANSSPQSSSQSSSPASANATTNDVTPDNADIRIGIHGTSQTDDDYVRVGAMEPCLIRLNSPLGSDVNIVLTSPDDNFRFNGGTSANQLYLTLPGDGSAVQFSVIGVTASQAVGSSEIHAHVGYATAPRPRVAALTVFELVDAKVKVTRGRDYERDTTTDIATYTPNGGAQAIDMLASINTSPSGVNLSAPQLQDLRVALVQNVTSSNRRAVARYPRAISWDSGLAAGYTVTIDATKERVTSFSGPLLDITDASALANTFIYDPSAIGPLNGSAVSNDIPGYSIKIVYEVENSFSSTPIVTYKYSTVRFYMRDNFLTYCFLVSPTGHEALRQTSWYLNLDTSGTQHAIVSASDSTVQSQPTLGGTRANVQGANSTSYVPATATTTLSKTSPLTSSAP